MFYEGILGSIIRDRNTLYPLKNPTPLGVGVSADIAKKELNSNTTLKEEEKKLIKMDKEGYYLYRENTKIPETSYETGWYIKWQGIKVQDSTVITEGGQISQVKP